MGSSSFLFILATTVGLILISNLNTVVGLDLKFCSNFEIRTTPITTTHMTIIAEESDGNENETISNEIENPSPSTSPTTFTIPSHLMSNLKSQTYSVENITKRVLQCKGVSYIVKLSLSESRWSRGIGKKNNTQGLLWPKAQRLRGRIANQFTEQGNFEYNNFTYEKNHFCIASISDSELEVEHCPINCGENGVLCIPKCCGVGEVAVYWNWTCIKVPESKSWTPFLYEEASGDSRVKEKVLKSIELRYKRPFMNCTIDYWPLSYARKPLKDDPGHHQTMYKVLKNGQVVHLQQSRRWKNIPKGDYCLDGFVNWGKGGNASYTGIEEHQVMLLCNNMEHHNHVDQQWIDDLYAGVLYFLSIFILLTVIVHVALFDRQNIHGFTIMSQAISIFCFYVSYGTVYFVTHRRDPNNPRSFPCLALAIFSHFSFLTTFSWLTVVNFDLWLTFRSMRPISRVSKKMRRFRFYSLIGWGIPLVLISIFVALDFKYRDINSGIIVPDYGILSCYVASWARWQYICSILAIVIPINLIMIIWTFKIFYDFNNGQAPKMVLNKRAKSDKYSLKLFAKLFLVMGSIWTFDAIFCWVYNNGEQSPWFIVILDCSILSLQAIAIFSIFCWNKRTLRNLEEKYPRFRVYFAPVKRLLKIEDPNLDITGTDTCPATPGGTRKMSSSSVMSMTLERERKGTMERKGTLEKQPSSTKLL